MQETLEAIEFFLNHFDGKDVDGVPHISKLLSYDFELLKASAAELEDRMASYKVAGRS